MDDLLLAGHSLLAFRAGDAYVAYIIEKETGQKLAVGHGPDLQSALADLWEKTNAQ